MADAPKPLTAADLDAELDGDHPIFNKMDALIARHRGQGPDRSIPTLTEIAPTGSTDGIPVLTNVAPMIGDDLMFTPAEIRAEAPPPVEHRFEPPAKVEQASAPAVSKPVAPPSAMPQIELPPVFDRTKSPLEKLASATVEPSLEFDLPPLDFAPSKPAAPAPEVAAPTVEDFSAPLMPELALDFDFESSEPAVVAPPPAPPEPEPAVLASPAAPQAEAEEEISFVLPAEVPLPADDFEELLAEPALDALAEEAVPVLLEVVSAEPVADSVPEPITASPWATAEAVAQASSAPEFDQLLVEFPDEAELSQGLVASASPVLLCVPPPQTSSHELHLHHPDDLLLIPPASAPSRVSLSAEQRDLLQTELMAELRAELAELVQEELARHVLTLQANLIEQLSAQLETRLQSALSQRLEQALERRRGT